MQSAPWTSPVAPSEPHIATGSLGGDVGRRLLTIRGAAGEGKMRAARRRRSAAHQILPHRDGMDAVRWMPRIRWRRMERTKRVDLSGAK